MPELTSALAGEAVQLVLHVIYALIIIFVGFRVVKQLSWHIEGMKLLTRIDPNVSSFIMTSSSLLLRFVVLALAAWALGIPGSVFITLFGSAGVAIGLAMQGSLSNLAGGLMLLIFHPFRVGDYIRAGENEGTVHQISAFYTTIITVDNKSIVLPNGTLTNSTLVNFSAESTRLLMLPFSVSYDCDCEQVRRILLDVAGQVPMVLTDPAPTAPMTAHDASAIVFTLHAWVACENYKPAKYELLERVKIAFDRENISIPYPQMDVHMKS